MIEPLNRFKVQELVDKLNELIRVVNELLEHNVADSVEAEPATDGRRRKRNG